MGIKNQFLLLDEYAVASIACDESSRPTLLLASKRRCQPLEESAGEVHSYRQN
jgi:hypothetical protein